MAKKPIQFVPADLTDEEIEAVRLEVQSEVAEEDKKAQLKALKAKLKREARAKAGLEEEQVDIIIDLAPYETRILLDNVAYMHGRTYTVPASKAAVMREIMQNTWRHQSEIDGKSENFYRKTRDTRVTPANMNAPASGLMRA